MTATVDIPSPDSFALGATLFRSSQSNGRAVLLHAATGVRRGHYAKFPAYLAQGAAAAGAGEDHAPSSPFATLKRRGSRRR